MQNRLPFILALAVALVASASTWFYMNRILRTQQIADAAAHGRPRGNLSDLYPRWLGTRELLLHGRNPYGFEVTREIQQGYYGRPLDPSRPGDPKDQQAFAYPVYVIFLLAPTVDLPFDRVQKSFRWLLILLVPATVLLWLRVLRWRASLPAILILSVLMLGWLPMVQAIKLQQLTLLVTALLAGAGSCLAGGWLFVAGGLVALATIKPQLTWPTVLWLMVWAVSEWRVRRRFVFGFALMMLLLLGGAQLVLPGWLRMFVDAIGQYHRYTQTQSVLVWLLGSMVGRMAEAASVLICGVCVFPLRREAASSSAFGLAFSLVLALSVLIVPMASPYNQVLLAPSIMALLRSHFEGKHILPALRMARAAGAVLLVWPWVATISLCLAYFLLTPKISQRLWPAPFYSNFLLPVFVLALTVLETWGKRAVRLPDGVATE